MSIPPEALPPLSPERLSEPLSEIFDTAENRDRVRSTVWILVAMLAYQGYSASIVVIASPWIAKSFALSEPALARVFAWLALAALGSMLLTRMVDRTGRRRVLIGPRSRFRLPRWAQPPRAAW